jgi:two-component system, cell cycle response regulator
VAAKILIVEDNATNLELMVYLLQAFGHGTFTAANGMEGLSALLANPVDLVVCDLEMPVMDGYTFARNVRAAKQYTDLPLVAVSAYAMVGDREKVLGAGFDGYISKPIDPETFVGNVQSYLPAKMRTPSRPVVDQAAAPSVPLPPAVAKVLVLDDSATNLTLMRSTLEPSGFEVVSATRIAEAQAAVRQGPPDLIMCDFHLCAESGLDFLRWVRAQPGLKSVPFVIVTSSVTDASDRLDAMAAGAESFITRPVEPEALIEEARRHLVDQFVPNGSEPRT